MKSLGYAYLMTQTYPYVGRCLNGEVSEDSAGPPPGAGAPGGFRVCFQLAFAIFGSLAAIFCRMVSDAQAQSDEAHDSVSAASSLGPNFG
jgi:hypothetical protein